MNVMLNIEELIIHLQKKITEYRYHQKRSHKARSDIRGARDLLLSLKTDLQGQLASAFKVYRSQMAAEVALLADHFKGVIARVRGEREEEVRDLHGEIERQHQVISAMRKEVEDLQELMIMQGAVGEREQQQQSARKGPGQGEGEGTPARTYGGLQMIEQQTERTLMSSARSVQEQPCNSDAFIRIEEQQQEQQSYLFQRQPTQEFKLASCERPSRTHSESSCSPSEWPSQEQVGLSKLEQMMELSHFSQRLHSLGEQPFPHYQSLPISVEYLRPQQECLTWQGPEASLKDITNSRPEDGEQSEQERQSRSKMFLEQFRRTFNKCLSSSNSSRKGSVKLDSSNSNTKNLKSTREQRGEGQRESQRLISEMLRDIDNNNKFCVGGRKAEMRYEGGRKGGCREGQGTLYYSNGFCYEGEFRNNLRHGYGVLKYNQTEIYRGEWQADELNGQGKIRNATAVNRRKGQTAGSPLLRWVSYCGYFRSNRFEGEGTLYLQGGQKFLGRFICGSACGEGTLYRKNGQVETGIWRNNQLVENF